MIGIAKINATRGDSVGIALHGSVDGYTGLRVGAPYFARYDGGVDPLSDETRGVSSQLVGRALTSDVMLATVSMCVCVGSVCVQLGILWVVVSSAVFHPTCGAEHLADWHRRRRCARGAGHAQRQRDVHAQSRDATPHGHDHRSRHGAEPQQLHHHAHVG
jgi:hypothetical protein